MINLDFAWKSCDQVATLKLFVCKRGAVLPIDPFLISLNLDFQFPILGNDFLLFPILGNNLGFRSFAVVVVVISASVSASIWCRPSRSKLRRV